MLPRIPSWKAVALVGLTALTTMPAALAGQAPRQPRRHPDFLFGRPHVTVGIRAGYAIPMESPSDIFNQLPSDQQLMAHRHNFNAASVSGELAVHATDRLDAVVDFGYTSAKIGSEFRDWLDNNDLPIEQTVRFKRRYLTFGVKEYLRDRGRSVSSLAWIPEKWAPFVGAGAGWTWYDYEQKGDFVDFQTLGVFSDRFLSSGKTGTLHLFGGADLTLTPNFLLTAEGRYVFAKSPMGEDFQGFKNINLSGFQASAGISLRF